jgi:hypothetical protein
MCAGIRNKKFFFRNQQYSKEEYEKILKSYRLDTFSGVEKAQKEHDEFILSYSRRYVWLKQNINCSGDVVSYSKNVKNSFITKKSENCRYCDLVADGKDCYDLSGSGELSECYESIVCDQSNRNLFGIYSWKNQDVFYTEHCHSSKSLFGCAGLRSAKHCIFNKQYTKEEYEKLVPKIIEQMNKMPYIDDIGNSYAFGEFYPAELSPFGYNETVADEFFPLEKEEAIARGYNWKDADPREYQLQAYEIPAQIADVPDSITKEILACTACKKNFKVVSQELALYRKKNIPVPHKCADCRHKDRQALRNPRKLWSRECAKCNTAIQTNYAPDRPERIYCEECCTKEVY